MLGVIHQDVCLVSYSQRSRENVAAFVAQPQINGGRLLNVLNLILGSSTGVL